jgi:CHAT domain-containing protein
LQGQVGVANLARAFIQAGANSVISTLWPVDDSYSLFLMQSLYRHLAATDDVASALAKAKQDLLSKFGPDTPPVYWAGFVILGNGRATLKTAKNNANHITERIQ